MSLPEEEMAEIRRSSRAALAELDEALKEIQAACSHKFVGHALPRGTTYCCIRCGLTELPEETQLDPDSISLEPPRAIVEQRELTEDEAHCYFNRLDQATLRDQLEKLVSGEEVKVHEMELNALLTETMKKG